jgi:hypothetical protein
MTSEDIVKGLGEMTDRPWSDWKRGKPINQVQTARMLRGFGIKSTTIRIGDKTPKGYHATDIVAAHNRYAPTTDPQQPQQKINDNKLAQLEAVFVADRTATEKDTSQSDPKHNANGHDSHGFDWWNGEQKGETDDEQWARIKAEHAAKRAAGN